MNTRLTNLFASWGHGDLSIRKAEATDITVLQRICDAWIEKGFFEGETLPSDYIEQCLKNGDLPPVPNAVFENYALFVVENANGIIGLFDIYDGYPDSGTAWIGLMLLDIDSRGLGIGKELNGIITEACHRHDFESLGLGVSMNHRIALKFWVNGGFKEILGIYGDLKYPVMALKKRL